MCHTHKHNFRWQLPSTGKGQRLWLAETLSSWRIHNDLSPVASQAVKMAGDESGAVLFQRGNEVVSNYIFKIKAFSLNGNVLYLMTMNTFHFVYNFIICYLEKEYYSSLLSHCSVKYTSYHEVAPRIHVHGSTEWSFEGPDGYHRSGMDFMSNA